MRVRSGCGCTADCSMLTRQTGSRSVGQRTGIAVSPASSHARTSLATASHDSNQSYVLCDSTGCKPCSHFRCSRGPGVAGTCAAARSVGVGIPSRRASLSLAAAAAAQPHARNMAILEALQWWLQSESCSFTFGRRSKGERQMTSGRGLTQTTLHSFRDHMHDTLTNTL